MHILYTTSSAAPQPGRLLQQLYIAKLVFTNPGEWSDPSMIPTLVATVNHTLGIHPSIITDTATHSGSL